MADPTQTTARPWWERPGLESAAGRLLIAGRDAETLAREHGTPLIAYDLTHVRERLLGLRAAFERSGQPYRLRVALKALRSPEFLAAVRALGAPGSPAAVGIDACSPGEVEHALGHGFLPSEISVSATNLTERDLLAILARGVHVNADLLTQLDRLGRLGPGARCGVRVNPRLGAVSARSAVVRYSGDKPTKFGIYAEDLERAAGIARTHGLAIDTVHFHVANGLLDEDLPAFDRAAAAVAAMVERLIDLGCPVAEINAGGGLGVALYPDQTPLDLDAYVAVLTDRLGHFGATLSCEPGTWVCHLAGTLLAEVATVEERLGHLFAGLDLGWNVLNWMMVYKKPVPVIHTTTADAPAVRAVTFTGNINEGPDLFVEDLPFPEVAEGDIVALYGAGAYSLTNYHAHCLRPPAHPLFFAERTTEGRPAVATRST